MGDRLGTPGVVGFWYDSLGPTCCKNDVRPVRFFSTRCENDMIVQFCVRLFFENWNARPHPRRNPESDEESVLTLISVTVSSLIFFICN